MPVFSTTCWYRCPDRYQHGVGFAFVSCRLRTYIWLLVLYPTLQQGLRAPVPRQRLPFSRPSVPILLPRPKPWLRHCRNCMNMIIEDDDNKLFLAILNYPDNILHQLLPKQTIHDYCLGCGVITENSPVNPTMMNLVTRILYKVSC